MSGTLAHLRGHHGDFAAFRDTMIDTSPGRFGPIWWGVWDQLVAPAPDATIVDLGCGPGWLLGALRARLPSARLYGVEVQPVMLEAARARAAEVGATILESDLVAPVALPAGSADVVTCVHVVHELPYPVPLYAEMARLLRPGGRAVVYDWIKIPLATYLGADPLDEHQVQHFREHCLYAPEDLEHLARHAGLAVVETLTRRNGRYALLVLEKAA